PPDDGVVTQGFPDTRHCALVDDAEGCRGEVLMRPYVILLMLVLASALTLVVQVHGIAPYSLSINPSSTSLGNSVTITVTITNGVRNAFYGATIGVQKPKGTGSAISNQVISTDNRGSGSVPVQYSSTSTSWTVLNGTVATKISSV